MYQPPHFREDDLGVQHALIRAHPLSLLITAGASGLMANAVPVHLDPTASEKGTLRLHLAKANSQWRDIEAGTEVLAVFQGADAYITPSWYQTKQETGKVVPTWNYAIVQARGKGRVIDDPAWLLQQINALTAQQEEPRDRPWAVVDAPDDFIRAQIKGIIGVEIDIAAIEGKWKVSQNRPVADRQGVAAGLDHEAGQADMIDLVRRYGGLTEK
ncbi:FMN-binding negative transcriptional regulator [Rhizobium grahamii]|uniref:FMN-binding negative transcriptional regulator n=1 Tax=Rhizobium grahamii TaxID=1120045 RepID=A0A5Q0C7L0_9HYPH|nr:MULTISPECIES: FMN-binding negative transcriptional regulator [Rhizobium]QFY61938.1 FMN-binding negative transcriptional regulator [Rhizobium grahamii]QRM48886.1 FMN-binding negative transcriptional regulator [Rhizobium sp. BG6]